MAHDIAMLKLRNPTQLNRAVNLTCLPESSESVSDGKMCWVTGKMLLARVEGGGRWPCFIIQRDTAIPYHPHIPKKNKQPNKHWISFLRRSSNIFGFVGFGGGGGGLQSVSSQETNSRQKAFW